MFEIALSSCSDTDLNLMRHKLSDGEGRVADSDRASDLTLHPGDLFLAYLPKVR